jgi:hypothetical protein
MTRSETWVLGSGAGGLIVAGELVSPRRPERERQRATGLWLVRSASALTDCAASSSPPEFACERHSCPSDRLVPRLAHFDNSHPTSMPPAVVSACQK